MNEYTQITGNEEMAGELVGRGLGTITGVLWGDVECPYCNEIFDCGTGNHGDIETYICPSCKKEFIVKWVLKLMEVHR